MCRFSLLAIAAGVTCAIGTFPSFSHAAWVKVDDFETGFTSGATTTIDAQNGWVTSTVGSTNYKLTTDPTNASNSVLSINGTGGSLSKVVTAGDGIGDNSTGTIFIRFYMDTTASQLFGMYDATSSEGSSAGDTAAPIYIGSPNSANSSSLNAYTSSSTAVSVGTAALDTWYSLWIVAQNGSGNSATSDNIQFYLQGGTGTYATQQQLFSTGPITSFESRTTYTTELAKIIFRPSGSNGANNIVLYDDIYIDNTGVNLTSIPEPSGFILLGLAVTAVGVFCRKRQRELVIR